jgi:carbonic anhydrase/acetyltransferase-like protein (isoleucine patch superfamily)
MMYALVGDGGHAKQLRAILGDDAVVVPHDLEAERAFFKANQRIAVVNGVGGIGVMEGRAAVSKRLRSYAGGIALPEYIRVIAPSAVVLGSVSLGAHVLHTAYVGPGAFLFDWAIINTGAIVEHDAYVGSCTHIAPHATVLGNAYVGHESFVGAGAVVFQGVRVGDRCVIGAGAIVRADVPDDTRVVGVWNA